MPYKCRDLELQIEEAKNQEKERMMGILRATNTPLDIKTEQALGEKGEENPPK